MMRLQNPVDGSCRQVQIQSVQALDGATRNHAERDTFRIPFGIGATLRGRGHRGRVLALRQAELVIRATPLNCVGGDFPQRLNYAHEVANCAEVNGTKLPRGRHYGSVPCRLRKKIQRCGTARTDVEAEMNPQGSPLTSRDSENRVRSYDRQGREARGLALRVYRLTATRLQRLPQVSVWKPNGFLSYTARELKSTPSYGYGSGVFPAVVLDTRMVS